jgi:hypothetical protein
MWREVTFQMSYPHDTAVYLSLYALSFTKVCDYHNNFDDRLRLSKKFEHLIGVWQDHILFVVIAA